jgi:hypothetical protein
VRYEYSGNLNDRVWKQLEDCFELLHHLVLLRRFLDPRNVNTAVRPLPDGSNIENQELRASWALHRSWIRTLHYRTLYVGDDDHGVYNLELLLRLFCAYHDIENDNVDYKNRQTSPEFQPMINFMQMVYKTLKDFAHSLFVERRPGGPYSQKETLDYNHSPGEFGRLWDLVSKASNKSILCYVDNGHFTKSQTVLQPRKNSPYCPMVQIMAS